MGNNRSSNAHGHDDVAVFVFVGAVFGADLACGLRVLEFETDFAFVADGFEEIDQVGGVEAHDDGIEAVGRLDGVFGLTGLGGGGGDLQLVLLDAHLDGAGALVGELRDALDGRGEICAAHDYKFVVVARHDGFVVGELAGELAAGEDAMADAEEERRIVLGKLDDFSFGVAEERLQLLQSLAWDERFLFGADARKALGGFFDMREAMTVGGDHGDGFGLEDEQCAVERVAGLLVGDGEDRARDECAQRSDGDLDGAAGGELGNLREVRAGHADHAGVRAAGANLDPVVLEQLDGHVAVAEKADVVVELARGDGAGARLFDFGGARGTNALIQIGGGDDDLVVIGFEQEVGEDGNGGFALDDALRGGKLTQKILTADGDLHSRSLNGFFLFDSRHDGFPRFDWTHCTPDGAGVRKAHRDRAFIVESSG